MKGRVLCFEAENVKPWIFTLEKNPSATDNASGFENFGKKPKVIYKKDVERAYSERMENLPRDEKYPSREMDENWSLGQFGSRKREMMRALRKELVPPEWIKFGRPSIKK